MEIVKKEIDTSKRPKWVWAISIWYIFAFIYTHYSIYIIFNGSIRLNEAQQQYFGNLAIIDWGITVISSLLSFTAAITLFMLKKLTIKAWAAVLVFAVIAHIYSAASSNYIEALGTGGVIGAIVGFAILIAIYFYTKRLDVRGYLS